MMHTSLQPAPDPCSHTARWYNIYQGGHRGPGYHTEATARRFAAEDSHLPHVETIYEPAGAEAGDGPPSHDSRLMTHDSQSLTKESFAYARDKINKQRLLDWIGSEEQKLPYGGDIDNTDVDVLIKIDLLEQFRTQINKL